MAKGTGALPLPDPDELQRKVAAAYQKFQQRRGLYIGLGVVVFVLAVAAILLASMPRARDPGDFARLWARCGPIADRYRVDRSASDLLEGERGLEAFVATLRGTRTEGYGFWFLALYRYREAWTPDKVGSADRVPHLEKALGYLTRLGEERFDALLVAKQGWFSAGTGDPIANLGRRVKRDLEWAKSHDYTAPTPDPDLVAVLRTDLGDIYVQFYPDLAPRHVENFIRLAKAGAYNGTAFHFLEREPGRPQVVSGVSGGDPYSFFYPDPLKKEHLLRWGTGGVGYAVPPEDSRFKVRHQRGTVTSQLLATQRPRRADWDNGMLFHVVTSPSPNLDRRHSPFGEVTEGMDIVDRITQRKTAGEHPPYRGVSEFTRLETRDLLVEAVRIHKVLVYRGGELDEAPTKHDFAVDEAEKKLSSLPTSPVSPLEGEALYAGRRLRDVDAGEPAAPGKAFPFPPDVPAKPENAYGERQDAPPPMGRAGATTEGGAKDAPEDGADSSRREGAGASKAGSGEQQDG
ncbi:MAG: peptidylprolyl isomerase [Planctomycetota bacterium]